MYFQKSEEDNFQNGYLPADLSIKTLVCTYRYSSTQDPAIQDPAIMLVMCVGVHELPPL